MPVRARGPLRLGGAALVVLAGVFGVRGLLSWDRPQRSGQPAPWPAAREAPPTVTQGVRAAGAALASGGDREPIPGLSEGLESSEIRRRTDASAPWEAAVPAMPALDGSVALSELRAVREELNGVWRAHWAGLLENGQDPDAVRDLIEGDERLEAMRADLQRLDAHIEARVKG